MIMKIMIKIEWSRFGYVDLEFGGPCTKAELLLLVWIDGADVSWFISRAAGVGCVRVQRILLFRYPYQE